jgi:hypothetical protein
MLIEEAFRKTSKLKYKGHYFIRTDVIYNILKGFLCMEYKRK